MADKRSFPRKKKRLVVEFVADGSKTSGFTWDLSYTGLFIAAHHLPKMGEMVTVTLHLPNGKKCQLIGKAVRARRVPAALAMSEPNGFSLMVSGYSEDYTAFMSSL